MIAAAEEDEFEVYEVDIRSDTAHQDGVLVITDPFESDASFVKSMDVSPALKRKASRMSKRFEGTDGVETKRRDHERFSVYNLFDVVPVPYNMDFLAGMYEQSGPHFAAVNAKTYNTVGLGYGFKPSPTTIQALDKAEGNQKKLDRLRSKIEMLRMEHMEWIDSLNKEDSLTETLIKVYTDYETTGNGYIEIGRTSSGDIAYLGHVPATGMRVRRKRDGFVQMVNAKSAVFFRNYGDQETSNPIGGDNDPHEIIHFKKYTPKSDYYGIPDIIPAVGAVAGNKYAAIYNLDYFENKAVPRHVVIVKGATLSASAEKSLYEFFDVKLKGKNHRTLYVPLPNDDPERKIDFEIKPVEAGVQEASFIKYKDNNRDEILGAHRTPISKVAIVPGVSLSSARDSDKTFKEQVTRPQQDIFERRINQVVKEKSDIFVFSLNELSLTDEDTQSKIDERYLRMQVITPNEVRARMGLPGIDGGDEVVDLKPQQEADQRNTANASDARARGRSSNSPDSSGEARSPKGEGRSAE
jgi:PBSX family phage portal protein